MKRYTLKIFQLVALAIISLSANASTGSVEGAVEKEMSEIRQSAEFKQAVACYGLSDAAIESYLDGMEESLRYCLVNHPIKNTGEGMGGDLAYNQCLYPKWRKAVESAGITEAMEKRCGNDDDE
ncbi:hypothetical protein [Alkalimarinus coralli]|uniref:hypothetical protein n=1 Tax=Alkalimarinus coralli TaxID=2935863 RepID=UPI00202B3F4B|nr:hypothetical protein [Alkalimarinus coralli]